MVGKLKDWRRIATRYDRWAHTFHFSICIAAIVIFYLNSRVLSLALRWGMSIPVGCIFAIPLKDWREDMVLYGYPEALGNHEKTTIAWASSAWNFIARQLHTEARAFVRANKFDEALYLQ
jgi:hypothetical protein